MKAAALILFVGTLAAQTRPRAEQIRNADQIQILLAGKPQPGTRPTARQIAGVFALLAGPDSQGRIQMLLCVVPDVRARWTDGHNCFRQFPPVLFLLQDMARKRPLLWVGQP